MEINITVEPLNTPAIIKNCSHCGHASRFKCSNHFRVNAQQRNLDVWLIYRCEICGCTWNMDILSRVKPEEIDSALYKGFLNNSPDLAFKYAFDSGVLGKNGLEADYSTVTYAVHGGGVNLSALTGIVTINLKSHHNLRLRLDKLLSRELNLSRKSLAVYAKNGSITIPGYQRQDLSKIKLKGDMQIFLDTSKFGG